MALENILLGRVSRGLPQPYNDTDLARLRMGRYGEVLAQLLMQKAYTLSDEGSYFVATNPTMGTGIALTGAAQTAYVATTPCVLLRNKDAPGGKRIYLDYLRLLMTAAGTAGASLHVAVVLDSAERYSTGGTAITPVNSNMDSAMASVAQCYFGAITAQAAGAVQRIVGRAVLRGAIPVVNDQYILNFGGMDQVGHASALGGTAIIAQSYPFVPVVVGPGQVVLVIPWLPSQTAAPSAEFDMGWWER